MTPMHFDMPVRARTRILDDTFQDPTDQQSDRVPAEPGDVGHVVGSFVEDTVYVYWHRTQRHHDAPIKDLEPVIVGLRSPTY